MMQVLIVDDQARNRQLLRIVLGIEHGVEVVGESADGRQAVRDAYRLMPDVIVMDGQMPLMNGAEATRAIRRSHPQMLIIAYSSSDELGEEMRTAGAYAVVPKTGEPADLLTAIDGTRQAVDARHLLLARAG